MFGTLSTKAFEFGRIRVTRVTEGIALFKLLHIFLEGQQIEILVSCKATLNSEEKLTYWHGQLTDQPTCFVYTDGDFARCAIARDTDCGSELGE